MELGYGIESARLGASGDPSFGDVGALLHEVDFNHVVESESLEGAVTVRAQWAWSRIDNATYDPTGALGFGPLRFDDSSQGGYAQVSYRPSMSGSSALQKLEGVVRFDSIHPPGGNPNAFDERRWGSSFVQRLAAALAQKNRDGYTPNTLPRYAPVWSRSDHVGDALFAPRRIPFHFFDFL